MSMATETALPKVGREVEQFKFTVAGLDGESFKGEVARIAAAQSGNLGLRDAIADVAAGEFGEVGRETVLRIWQEAIARAAAPKVEVFKRRKLPDDPAPAADVARKAAPVFISPATQPAAEPKRKPEPEGEPAPVDEAEPAQQEPEEEEGEAAQQQTNLPAVVPEAPPPARIDWSDALEALNKRHAIVESYGGKTVITSWEPSPVDPGREVIVFQKKDSFLLRYCNRTVRTEIPDGKGGYHVLRAPLGHVWLSHRQRRQYRGIVFVPGGAGVINRCLNLWRGWGVVPKAGDWRLIRAHIEQVIADGNAEFALYVIRWIAWSIKHPGAPAEVALVLIGEKGAGKGTLIRCLERIFGLHAFQVTSRDEVIGKFNGHLQDAILFVADEAYWGGDKRCVGRLQGMITEPKLPIERKGFDLVRVPNCLHVLMLAEPGWVIPAGRYERRYAALTVSDRRREDKEYFTALYRQIAEGGAEAMMWDLMRMDLGDWHPREIPASLLKGAALQRQQAFTLPPLEQWYFGLLKEGSVPGALINYNPQHSKKISRPNTAYTYSLTADARERFPRLRWELSDIMLEDFVTDERWPKAKKYRDAHRNGWTFEPLKESREAWDQRYGPQKWNDVKEWG
jgi:hypothetical protein